MQSTIDEKRAALTVAERELCGGSGLLDVIKKAVFVSIEQTLESINSHARFHLEAMHPDDYIDVRLNNIATTQKGANKLQISVSINHKGGAGTLDELSGGEGQKCELAFILAVNDLLASKILMLDETVVYLDADVTQSILDYLKTQAENKLILVVSHTLVTGVFDEIIEV